MRCAAARVRSTLTFAICLRNLRTRVNEQMLHTAPRSDLLRSGRKREKKAQNANHHVDFPLPPDDDAKTATNPSPKRRVLLAPFACPTSLSGGMGWVLVVQHLRSSRSLPSLTPPL